MTVTKQSVACEENGSNYVPSLFNQISVQSCVCTLKIVCAEEELGAADVVHDQILVKWWYASKVQGSFGSLTWKMAVKMMNIEKFFLLFFYQLSF